KNIIINKTIFKIQIIVIETNFSIVLFRIIKIYNRIIKKSQEFKIQNIMLVLINKTTNKSRKKILKTNKNQKNKVTSQKPTKKNEQYKSKQTNKYEQKKRNIENIQILTIIHSKPKIIKKKIIETKKIKFKIIIYNNFKLKKIKNIINIIKQIKQVFIIQIIKVKSSRQINFTVRQKSIKIIFSPSNLSQNPKIFRFKQLFLFLSIIRIFILL